MEDDADLREEIARGLARSGHAVTTREDAASAFEVVLGEEIDVVVSDLNLKRSSGIDLCERVVAHRRDIPVIALTGFGTMETAIATLRAGAFDFLTKPFNIEQLLVAVERALRHRVLVEEVRRLRGAAQAREGLGDMLGRSAAMQRVFALVERVAESDATVLVTGESGSGKELIARAIHERGARRDGPMVSINCAAMPESLLESELFGHVRGAFTDAKTARRGLFLDASGGTLFLDELGEMPLGMQAKLLRALEDRKVRPVGGTAEVAFDARVITATNRDLESLVAERRFREDLYYRINVVHVEVPPLRSRGDDALVLAQAFLKRFSARHAKQVTAMTAEVAERILSYSWPGNVRELQNAIERAVALTTQDPIGVEDLPPRVRDYKPSHVVLSSDDPTELVTLEEVEKRYMTRVMEAVGGNKTVAARVLGLDRSTLYRKLERYGLSSS